MVAPARVQTIGGGWNSCLRKASDFLVEVGDAPGKSRCLWSRARSAVNGPGVPGAVTGLLAKGGDDLDLRFMWGMPHGGMPRAEDRKHTRLVKTPERKH